MVSRQTPSGADLDRLDTVILGQRGKHAPQVQRPLIPDKQRPAGLVLAGLQTRIVLGQTRQRLRQLGLVPLVSRRHAAHEHRLGRPRPVGRRHAAISEKKTRRGKLIGLHRRRHMARGQRRRCRRVLSGLLHRAHIAAAERGTRAHAFAQGTQMGDLAHMFAQARLKGHGDRWFLDAGPREEPLAQDLDGRRLVPQGLH